MRFTSRLALAMIGLVLLTATVVGYLTYRNLVAAILPAELVRLDAHAQRSVAVLDGAVSDAGKALSGFRNSVALRGLVRARRAGGVDPETHVAAEMWRRALVSRFEAELEIHPEFMEFELIGSTKDGPEIVRVDRSGRNGAIRDVPASEFHPIADLPGAVEVGSVQDAGTSVSSIALNREHGVVQVPHVPVVWLATPVVDTDGSRDGVLAIKLDFGAVLRALPPIEAPEGVRYVVDADGDFIVHPDPSKTFGFDLGARHLLQDEAPALARLLPAKESAEPRLVAGPEGRRFGVALAEARLGGGPRVSLLEIVPERALLAPTAAVRRASLMAGGAALIVAMLVALAVARSMTRPLVAMTRAVASAGADEPLHLPAGPSGEFRVLGETIERMHAADQMKTAALRASEERYRRLFESMVEGVAYCRMIFEGDRPVDWVYLSVNRAFETQTGLKGVEGLRVTDVVPGIRESDPQLFEIYGRVALSREARRFELFVKALDAWFDINVYSPEPGHFVAVFDVITERKNAEKTLRESEERFRQLAENINEVFWMADPVTDEVLYVSPAYETVWGRSCASLLRERSSWLDALHPEDREAAREAAATKQIRGDYDETYRIVRPDGSVRWIRDRAYPLRNPAGDVFRVVGVAEDITRPRELEEQIRQAQKMESIGRLAAGVAHDFNNLLTIVHGSADLLLESGVLPSRLRGHAEHIAAAAQRAAALTQQLLTFGRKQVMRRGPVDLNAVVRDMTKMLARVLGEDVALEVRTAEGLPAVFADKGMLEQVVLNLAVNSRDAMPSGGRLTLATSVEGGGARVCLRVTDTGEGISPENLERIFDPFFTTKDVGKGTGLGLATVYAIVEQHGGRIDVASEPGRGATFRISFPVAGPEARAVAAPPASVAVRGGGETILLVEDEPAVREMTRGALERLGYAVIEAESAVRALEIWRAARARIDLVITDMVMPEGKSGGDLSVALREEEPTLPILFTSGYNTEHFAGEFSLREGINYFQKPYSLAALAEAVRAALDR